ncbi:hypothetical protein IFR05_005266 [Cadophora sp. M221]|nr:hypothetical protein IFR05_005266 [Cadophora sp. M221]
MSDDADEIIYRHCCPQGVKRVIASGSSAFVGVVDDSTVLKYPFAPGGDLSRLEIEKKLLQIIGPHPRIIGYKGFSNKGLHLERAEKGTLADCILESGNPLPTIHQRLCWFLEAAEAVAHIHSCKVLHCDIQPTHFLLDKDLSLKLPDFQGQQLSEE